MFIRQRLLEWYVGNGRSFLWRENSDPYVVLVAEILLKKTSADLVNRFLPGFLDLYPNSFALSTADFAELKETLSPLGLSVQRGQQFKKLGQALVDSQGGRIPCNRQELLSLPGVGDYTANAVLCFAFLKPEPIVDTNVARILVRFYGIICSRYEARRSPEIWEQARAILGTDKKEIRRINWALLDLGALICRARSSKCGECPLKRRCSYHNDS